MGRWSVTEFFLRMSASLQNIGGAPTGGAADPPWVGALDPRIRWAERVG